MTQIMKFYKPIKDKDRYMKFNLKWKNKAKRMIKNIFRSQQLISFMPGTVKRNVKRKTHDDVLKKVINDKHTRAEVKPYLERKLNEILST